MFAQLLVGSAVKYQTDQTFILQPQSPWHSTAGQLVRCGAFPRQTQSATTRNSAHNIASVMPLVYFEQNCDSLCAVRLGQQVLDTCFGECLHTSLERTITLWCIVFFSTSWILLKIWAVNSAHHWGTGMGVIFAPDFEKFSQIPQKVHFAICDQHSRWAPRI